MIKKKNILNFFLNTFVTTSVSLIFITLIAQNYTKADFGQFSYAQNIFLIIYALCFSNYYFYLIKELKNNYKNKNLIISACLTITFLGSFIGYMITYFITIIFSFDKQIIELILILNLSLIILPFGVLYYELIVLKIFKDIFYITIIAALFSLTLKIILIYTKSPMAVIIWSFVFDSLILVVLCFLFYKKNNLKFKFIFSYKETKKMLKSLSLYPLLSFLSLASLRIDVVMIKELLNFNYLADYSICSRIVILVILFLSNILKFFYPFFQGKKKNDIINYLLVICSAISLSSIIFIFLFSRLILSFFGNDYVELNYLIQILSLNIFFLIIADIFILKNYFEGKYIKIVYFYSSLIVLNIILNIILAKHFLIIGVSISTVVSTFLSLIIFFYKDLYEFFLSLNFSNIKKMHKIIFN
jgi:O-antigen/teichoic acid export membrane protein